MNSFNDYTQGFSEKDLANYFTTIDDNYDGGINIYEAKKHWQILCKLLGRNYDENQVEEVFKNIDKDKDGNIDFEEFKNAFQHS